MAKVSTAAGDCKPAANQAQVEQDQRHQHQHQQPQLQHQVDISANQKHKQQKNLTYIHSQQTEQDQAEQDQADHHHQDIDDEDHEQHEGSKLDYGNDQPMPGLDQDHDKQQDQHQHREQQQHHSGASGGDIAKSPDSHDDELGGESTPEELQLTNLIVNYLPQSMSQDEIRQLFSSIGEVESCKLIRDRSSINQSLGYGFVNYVRHEDAQRAIKSFNGLRLQNKTIKVSYARPSSDSIKGANLYVSGLPKSMTQLELELLFKPYGKIITSRILCDNLTGISKGVGFVRFDQRFEAERAIEHLNNTYVWVRNNQVGVSRRPIAGGEQAATGDDDAHQQQQHQSQAVSESPQQQPIVVKFANSPSSNPQKQIAAAVAAIAASGGPGGPQGGPVGPASTATAAAVALSLAAGHPPGAQSAAPHHGMHHPMGGALGQLHHARAARLYAHGHPHHSHHHQQHQQHQGPIYHNPANRFRYSPMAAECLFGSASSSLGATPTQALFGWPLGGAARAASSAGLAPIAAVAAAGAGVAASTSGWCLFVYNLAPEVEDSTLWKLFAPFGAVQQVNLIKDAQSGKCKGFAFVTMSDYAQAMAAIASLNGFTLANRVLQVSFKTAKVRPNKPSSSTQ